MADTAAVRNDCPANLTYDVDLLGHGAFAAVAPGDVIEVPVAALPMLSESVWSRVDAKKPKSKQQEGKA